MSSTVQSIDKFHQTKKGRLTFGFLEILVAYAIASRAIDTGSLWQYLFSILFLIGGINNTIRAFAGSNAKKSKR